jgi:hypothetical protein
MRTLSLLLLLLGCATVVQAQPPKSYTPATPPRAGEETILNARVVSVDRTGSRLTVRGVDVKADGGSNETFTVAAPAAGKLTDLKPGMEVLLTLRGTTVTDVKVSVASGGEGGNVIQGGATAARPGSSSRGRSRTSSATGTGARGTAGTGASGTGTAATTGTAIPGGVVPVAPVAGTSGAAQPAVTGTAPGTTPGMIGIAPGTGAARTNTNAQGTITLQGSPAPAGAARTAVTPRPGVNPQGTVPQAGGVPQGAAVPQTGVVSPQPAAGGPVTGAAPGTVPGQGVPATNVVPGVTGPVVVPGVITGVGGAVIVASPSPAVYGTPFPTPRPVPTPIPVGTPPPQPTPVPVLVPADAPSPTPTPSPQTP